MLDGSEGRSLQDLAESVPDDYPKNTRTVRRKLEVLGLLILIVSVTT
jgi:hypothetical protein